MRVSPSSTSQAAAWRLRVPPPPEQIRPGLWAIATPVPTPISYTLCYVFDADGRLLVVDPGWPDEAALRSLVDGLAGFGRTVDDIDAVLVTHLHPDHVGLADRLLRRVPGARLLMHPADLERFLPGGGAHQRGPAAVQLRAAGPR
jgi:glyoxylase-like metal-dependent hydrolase (beta-lactamase superfamily II)